MFLRSLTMKGFKSFADTTVLEFEPGVTVVVGPNGSGKSNVVDATTWVLGAQGPRSLRSQKMEDVIFAGTSARPALGRAEVSITIDNASGRLPVDLAEVTITRTLFRSGESEYSLNGSPCRLLDIQELLSDSGVGRTQHMIIGQGQLDSVLSARPEDRRAVIEEAAGVLKHRRRRERAERRLAATEENLERLGDLVREVRRQIRPLERQAAAARSHATLERELHAVRLHLSGQELKELADRHGQVTAARSELGQQERDLQSQLATLDAEATEATARLSSERQGDLAATVARVRGLAERARGTTGILRERAHGLEASLEAAADVDVVSTLEAEGARLAAELEACEEDRGALHHEGQELEAAEGLLDEEERTRLHRTGTDPDPRDAEEALARARDRVGLLRRSADQHRRALHQLQARAEALEQRQEALVATEAALGVRAQEAADEQQRLAHDLEAKERALQGAEARLGQAAQAARRSEEERHRTAARAEALTRALDELRNQPGRKALAGAAGVVGALADLITVDVGWESAFEAAAGGAEGAVVVAGPHPARQAVAQLHHRQVSGAVLALAEDRPAGPSGAGQLGEPGVEALRPHVHLRPGVAPEGLAGLLDRLLANVVRAPSWEAALELANRRPELVVVTEGGDNFSRHGWRVRRGAPVVTAAAVEAAGQRARAAEGEAVEADGRRAGALEDQERARVALTEAQRANDRHRSVVSGTAAERSRLSQALDQARGDVEDTASEVAATAAEAAGVDQELAELQGLLPRLEHQALAAQAARRAAEAVRAELAEQRRQLAERRRDFDVRAASTAERLRVLSGRRDEVERRLAGHVEERRQAAARRARLERDVTVVHRLEALVEGVRRDLEGVHHRISEAYQGQVEEARAGGQRLDALHRQRNQVERRLEALRDRSRELDVELAEISMRAATLTEAVRQDLGAEPEAAVHAACPELPAGTSAADHAEALAARLGALGPVNPLALEELSELEARAGELDGQVQDVKTARRELHQVVRHLDEEIMESFAAAVADVNEHFSALSATLFPGGTGRLMLTEPENLLETGVDLEVRPLGRNVRRVSLLSGGERSLVAIAFLFAIFRSRPSPFYLMDEVEAALDDVNLHRFLELVHEFRTEAQLIIVSHQKRTMEMADALYGVTMAPGGSSKAISQKVTKQAPGSGPAPASAENPDSLAEGRGAPPAPGELGGSEDHDQHNGGRREQPVAR